MADAAVSLAGAVPRRAEQGPASSLAELALTLTRQIIIQVERRKPHDLSKKDYLDLYAECLEAVAGRRHIGPIARLSASLMTNGDRERYLVESD